MTSTPSPSAPSRPLVRIGILWSADGIAATAWTVVDVLRAMNAVAVARHGSPPVQWGWLGLPDRDGADETFPAAADAISPGEADVIVIPGWLVSTGPQLREISGAHARHFAPLLRSHAARGGRIAAFFNGSALLADAGLLAGREVALPWVFAPSIAFQSGHAVAWRRDKPWHADGAIWSTAALPCAAEAFFDLLSHTPVAELAKAVSTALLYDPQRQLTATAALETPTSQPLAAGALELARRWLQAHCGEPYSLAATARAAATSPRTLLRWFSQVHGQTPLEYLHGLRVAQAQALLQTTYLTVEAVAQQCGYRDTGSFRKVFTRHAGTTPGAYRQRFQLRSSRKQWDAPATDPGGLSRPTRSPGGHR